MPSLLPIVKEETGFSLQAELLECPENQYVLKHIKRLENDNPCIANFISQLAVLSGDPQSVAYAGILVYRLLESQAETDNLEKLVSTQAT